MSKIDEKDGINPELVTLSNLPKNAKFFFELIKYYETYTSTKVDYSKFNGYELERFVLWYLLNKSTKTSTCNGYVTTLKLFLNQVFAINVDVPVSEIASKIRILTKSELSLIKRMQLSGYRNKISDLLRFRIASGCEHGKFKLVTTNTKYFDPERYFTYPDASGLLDRYDGMMPTIPKSDFDSGVTQLLHALKIDRKVKIGDDLVPVCDMDVDLLINNTYTYHATHRQMSMDKIVEMFEYDEFSHYFPAISCINNQIIELKYNILQVIDGVFNLIVQKVTPLPKDLPLPRFEMNLQQALEREHSRIKDYMGPTYMGVEGFDYPEKILTEYMMIMHKYGKKDSGN